MREHLTLFLLVIGALITLYFFSNIGKPEPVENYEVMPGRVTYQDEYILFDYSEDLDSKPIDDGKVMISEKGSLRKESFYFKVYERQTSFGNFEAFVQNEKARFKEYTDGKDVIEGEDYSFVEDKFNGLPVLIHTRSFGGVSGNASDMYVWLGRGKVYLFSSESDYKKLESIYKTVRPAG